MSPVRKPLDLAPVLCLIAAMLSACTPGSDVARDGAQAHAGVDAQRILTAASNNAEWLTHGRTYAEERHSPLQRINHQTVSRLGLAWYFDLDTDRGQEATPLVIDGVIYFSTAWSKVYAVNARSGEQIWFFDPAVPPVHAINACCDVVNRGVAAWGGNVYVGTLDGRLIALDRASGDIVWSVVAADPEQRYTITGAPRVVNGNVIIGNGGAEYGVRGYVDAYDAVTGEHVWRFYTVPGNPEEGFENTAMAMAAETWHGDWWQYGGGGTAWDSFAFDPALNLLYIGVGNGSPWNHQIRSNGKGDNLFLSSIVAVDGDTGEYAWHFQTTPAESWDYTATQHMILADLVIDGEMRNVIMQAPKNGFFYVLDRRTGEFVSGNNYVEVNWAEGLDPETGRPIQVPEARYEREPAFVMPGAPGGHNWYPMSFDQNSGLVYIPAQNTAMLYAHDENFEFRDVGWNTGTVPLAASTPHNPRDIVRARELVPASLLAWDPVAQREVWRVDYDVRGNSGVLSTSGGLVFQGSSDGRFHAYSSDRGTRIWSYDVGNAILGGPVTFELDGEQYVLALAGQGGIFGILGGGANSLRAATERPNGRLMAFKLDATGVLPDVEPPRIRQPLDLSDIDTDGDPEHGAISYQQLCAPCHGRSGRSSGMMPDLRFSPLLLSARAFAAVVRDGSLSDRGMAGFGSQLDARETEDLRAYLVRQAVDIVPE
jgi:quinohemoprotein ethanol dehydrogenase